MDFRSKRRKTATALSLASLLLALPLPVFAKDSLTVVTGYPDDFAQSFAQAFEAEHPDIAVQLLHKSGREALAFLSAPDHGGADVYWAASGNFAKLAEHDTFAPLKIDRSALPGKIGPLSFANGEDKNSQDKFEAFELAGYGLAYSAKAAWKDKAPPQSWHDAAAPDLEGQIIMPIDAKVGFASALYEIILQSEGWEQGWALLSEIAGDAVLTGNPHDLAPIETGHAALSLTIDFIALNAAAKGQAIAIAYPQKTAFLPAYVAELANAPHPQAAEAFVAFLLSPEGQKILLRPGIDRYPVRPDAYPANGAGVDPFKLPAASLTAYDPKLTEMRRPLDAALFDAAFVAPHDRLAPLWHKIHAAEKYLKAHPDAAKAQQIAEARRLAGLIPVAEKEARDPAFLMGLTKDSSKISPEIIAKWTSDLATARDKAADLLANVPDQ
jgi:ABC-type Fe3+ transport system substrate-binding protein